VGRSAGSSAARGAIAGVIPRWGRRCSPSLDPIRIAGLIQCGRAGGTACPTCRTPDVVEFGMSPFSWRRHSCLLGRDSSRPSSRGASTVPERREESRRRRHECLRHVMAQVNFPNYPKSRPTSGVLTCEALAIERNGSAHFPRQAECRWPGHHPYFRVQHRNIMRIWFHSLRSLRFDSPQHSC
jgi:hypothetical protein